MKNIQFIILFLPCLCNAQQFIGVSRSEVEKEFKKIHFDYKLSPSPLEEKFIEFNEAQSTVKLYLKNDTVDYYQIFSPKEKLNKIKQLYDKQFYINEEFYWTNYVPHLGVFVYTIQFIDKFDGFMTTVQKVK